MAAVFLVVFVGGWNERGLFLSLGSLGAATALVYGIVTSDVGSGVHTSCVAGFVLLTIILFLVWKGGDQRLTLR